MTGQDLDSTLLCSKTWEQSVVEFTQRTKYTVIYSFSQESYCYAVCKQKVKVKSLSRVRLFANPWTVAYQAPPSMGFSRQKYWSGLPFLSPGDFPHPGIKPRSPAFQADALTLSHQGSQCLSLPWWLSGKESSCQCRKYKRLRFNPWSERSPGEGNGHPFQYSCLGDLMDRGTWWVTVHGVERSQTQLSN